ncbi:NRAMP family divalent metal transporter [Mucilaginibacter myungsuensis]|uniref:Divalent metal cation transporter n=1 Tax=Mucilaginibacter myungsuensis TaxID=649104 RepID=A0A929PW50_9SPHI|nr:NRAMP family divalent metal transporter [Mucilaginibacter myungsuensis]MBE9660802.1 divalent metal cation transporter [Mucilaginibacter myungsuensis]MDN3600848.1 divalent metal cation transporter [Mucilaginibacter myungsuensis]
MTKKQNWSVLIGAAFLMASSAIGPGFLTQTAVFTEQLGASFGFVILLSIVLDAIAQLNVWRIITVADKPAQDIANAVFPGLGYFISFLVFLGGMAFNIGNIAGAGLGLNVLLGISVGQGAMISSVVAIGIFIYKESGKAMDMFAKVMGCLKIFLACYVAYISAPPMAEAALRSVNPSQFSFTAVLTIVGGTVGGYITFAGAHRLLDARIVGEQNLPVVNQGALSAIGLASVMRLLLFLAALGVITNFGKLDPANPAASVFQLAAGQVGYKLFGVIIWAAGISSVVGSAYTSISFIRTFHPFIQRFNREVIVGFILVSCAIFLAIGKPVKILLAVGAINGFILPIALGVMLIGAYRVKIIASYKQPLWLTLLGVAVVVTMAWMSVGVIIQMLSPVL